jgi:hypothetical protein
MMKVVSEEQNQAQLSGRANGFASFFTLHPDQAEKIKRICRMLRSPVPPPMFARLIANWVYGAGSWLVYCCFF